MAIAEAERIVEEAFRRHENNDDEPEPNSSATPDPNHNPRPPRVPTPDDEDGCPTNHPPGSDLPFDRAQEFEDIMCNIRKHTALSGPQPYTWWQSLRGRVNPIMGNWIGIGEGGLFIGREPLTVTNAGTGDRVMGPLGSLFLARPGYLGRNRADIMTVAVHELRHAGQYFSMFANQTVRGQRLSCANISGRIAEVDAWQKSNNWLVNSVQAGLIRTTDFSPMYFGDQNMASATYDNGNLWTENYLWDSQLILDYRDLYGASLFDAPPYFNCPATHVSYGCIDPQVMRHA
ncbi:MAG: hypothetical protein OHK0046_48300 [Anaerolineae bacterium]